MKSIYGIIGALFLTLTATSVYAQTTQLLVNCLWPPQHFMCKALLPAWKADVEKVTEGRVKISFPASNLAPAAEQMASARSGIYDAAIQANNFIANEVVGPRVAMLPLISDNSSYANSVALWRTYEKFLSSADEYDGVHLLSLVVLPGSDFFSLTNTPITSVETATNRKIWSPPGAIADILKKQGAGIVAGPAIQMTELVQRKVVDGFVGLDPTSAAAFGALSHAKSMTISSPSLFTASFSFVINEDKWNEISSADRDGIMSVSGEAFAGAFGRIWDEAGVATRQSYPEGFQVLEASDAFNTELAGLAQPYVTEWIDQADKKGIDGSAAREFYRATIESLVKK